jgi:hypothetical protein
VLVVLQEMRPQRSGSGTSTVSLTNLSEQHTSINQSNTPLLVSAVAGDMIAFERMPPLKPDGSEGTTAELVLHQYFLSLFGMSIGELWDLKALSDKCKELGRYSFLLTSAPLNVPGSIGSPPNALALF